MFKTLGVFCSASSHLDDKYFDKAKEFARSMCEHNYDLVYGGATIGLMGCIADEAKKFGAHVLGVVPKIITTREIANEKIDELIITEDMHERKKILYKRSDILVILPGGFGTLDEAFESITWNQLDIHKKPVVFINWFGYFDGIKTWIQNAEKEKFIKVYDTFEPQFLENNEQFFKWLKENE